MNILDKIVNAKKLRLDELKKNASLDEIKQKAKDQHRQNEPPRKQRFRKRKKN